MAVGVNIPKRQQAGDGGLGSLMQLGGMAVGAAYGGPQGAALGGSLGGMVGGLAGPEKQPAGPEAVPTSEGPMQRRMSSLQESPQMQIANSIDSLKYVQDPAQRAELAKPLMQADYMARNKQV